MSHFTTIETKIKDIDALRSACAELGLTLLQNTEARGYGGECRRAPFVIRLKGPFDVAVDSAADGTHGLTADWFDGHVEQEVGKNCGRLLQMYGVHKATKEARLRRLTVVRRTLKNGSIKLTIGGI